MPLRCEEPATRPSICIGQLGIAVGRDLGDQVVEQLGALVALRVHGERRDELDRRGNPHVPWQVAREGPAQVPDGLRASCRQLRRAQLVEQHGALVGRRGLGERAVQIRAGRPGRAPLADVGGGGAQPAHDVRVTGGLAGHEVRRQLRRPDSASPSSSVAARLCIAARRAAGISA